MRVVTQVARLGTVNILRLTEGMDKDKACELVTYISRLEESENRLVKHIQAFYNSVSYETGF